MCFVSCSSLCKTEVNVDELHLKRGSHFSAHAIYLHTFKRNATLSVTTDNAADSYSAQLICFRGTGPGCMLFSGE